MSLKFCFLLLLVQVALSVIRDKDPVVTLPNGSLVQGLNKTTLEDKKYHAFLGIPYALPPTLKLAFKAPQPHPHWNDTLPANQYMGTCFELSTGIGNEDCLFVNVFTPQLPTSANNVSLPVMFYIHGGGFVDGSSNIFNPDMFVNNDIVFVSINYRTEIFGFLSTGDEVVPGNNGLKDQQLALQRTHDNIRVFGGNPDEVTIFGQDAGAASCAYQLLNQKNKGLFRAAILQSGSFLSPWAFQRRATEIAFNTTTFLDPIFQSSRDSQALLDFLQSLPAFEVDAAAKMYRSLANAPSNMEISQGFYYAPVVEVKNPDAFLTKNMYQLLEAGNIMQVAIMIGITSKESLIFNPKYWELEPTMAAYDENLDFAVPNDMQISDKESKIEMGRKIRELYTGGKPWAENLGDAIRYFSDTSFTRSVVKHAEMFSQFNKTYFYIFSYDGPTGQNDVHYDGAEAVAHGEENLYLFCFDYNCDETATPKPDRVTRQRLVELWVNFAKYLNPTPEPSETLQNVTWPAVDTTNGDFYYLDIGENLEIKNHPKEETYKGWTELYESLNFTNFDTYKWNM